jgi:hypothetical protein
MINLFEQACLEGVDREHMRDLALIVRAAFNYEHVMIGASCVRAVKGYGTKNLADYLHGEHFDTIGDFTTMGFVWLREQAADFLGPDGRAAKWTGESV